MQTKNTQSGFSLIELLIVVLIIGILSSIAIPTFVGVINRAKDIAAQTTVRNAITAATSVMLFADNDSYAGFGNSEFAQEEPTLKTPVATSDTTKDSYKAGDNGVDSNQLFVGTPAGIGGSPNTPTNQGMSTGITICAVSKGKTVFCAKQLFNATTGQYNPWTFSKGKDIYEASRATATLNGWE